MYNYIILPDKAVNIFKHPALLLNSAHTYRNFAISTITTVACIYVILLTPLHGAYELLMLVISKSRDNRIAGVFN